MNVRIATSTSIRKISGEFGVAPDSNNGITKPVSKEKNVHTITPIISANAIVE